MKIAKLIFWAGKYFSIQRRYAERGFYYGIVERIYFITI